jgi:hypothetical protein
MARHQVAIGRDGLQVWRVAVNILNKQSRTADGGWSSSLGVGRRTNNPPPLNLSFVTNHHREPRARRDPSARPKHLKMDEIGSADVAGVWNGFTWPGIGTHGGLL